MKALERASKRGDGPVSINFDEYYATLGLNKDEVTSSSQLNRAYRKMALKYHPDKGGSVDEFKKIQEAFEVLMSKLEEEEEAKMMKTIQYTATIQKGPPGVGFGLSVMEDVKTGSVVVKVLNSTLIV